MSWFQTFIFILISSCFQGQLLYEIKSKDGLKTSYLYGTIHIMPSENFSMNSKIEDAFNQTKTLALEVDLNMSLTEKLDLAKETMLPNGQTLKDICTQEQYALIYNYCIDSSGMSKKKFKRYSHLKPFFFTSVLFQEELEETKSFELEFNKMAQKAEKKTMGLESMQVQMQTINSVSLENQVSMLIEGLQSDQSYDTMLTNYLNEDLNRLYDDIVEESIDFPNFVENFLNKRNRNWIPVITYQIEKEATFIAVGAGHLPGDQGVISLLRNQGYLVVPILLKP